MITPVEYLALKSRVQEELNNIKRLEASLRRLKLFPAIKADSINGLPLDDEISCRVIGSYLHDYYCCLERVFFHIARSFGESIPKGEQWHKELLLEMTLDIPGVRRAVLSKKTMAQVDELRGFRHVFRNAYGFNLNPKKEQLVLAGLAEISRGIKRHLDAFFRDMDQLILKDR